MNDVTGIHLLHPTMSLPCQVKQLVPEGPAKRPWRPLRHQQPTLTLRAWQKRWALHGNVPNWKSRRRWRWQRFSNIASFHDANAYFPYCLFFLFRFLVFASIARGWFLWILSSCRNPDSNLDVFSRFICPSLPSTVGGLIFRLHPERQHLGGSPKIAAFVVSGGQAWLYATSVLSTGETETTSLDCGGFGMKFLHIIFKWREGELLTIHLYEFWLLQVICKILQRST